MNKKIRKKEGPSKATLLFLSSISWIVKKRKKSYSINNGKTIFCQGFEIEPMRHSQLHKFAIYIYIFCFSIIITPWKSIGTIDITAHQPTNYQQQHKMKCNAAGIGMWNEIHLMALELNLSALLALPRVVELKKNCGNKREKECDGRKGESCHGWLGRRECV